MNENLWSFRLIDGTGEAYEVSRDDGDLFYAMSPNMGLLGVISTITFQCEDAYNITGQEAITTVADCAIDLFGPGDAERPSLEQFLRDAEYARVEWWPQRGVDRVLVWQAQRIRPQLGFRPSPYEEFTTHPDTAEAFDFDPLHDHREPRRPRAGEGSARAGLRPDQAVARARPRAAEAWPHRKADRGLPQ